MYGFRERSNILPLVYLDSVIKEYSAFIKIPFSDDFPHIVSIEYKDFELKKAIFLSAELRGHSEDEKKDYIEKISNVFDYAESKNKDLVFFNY